MSVRSIMTVFNNLWQAEKALLDDLTSVCNTYGETAYALTAAVLMDDEIAVNATRGELEDVGQRLKDTFARVVAYKQDLDHQKETDLVVKEFVVSGYSKLDNVYSAMAGLNDNQISSHYNIFRALKKPLDIVW